MAHTAFNNSAESRMRNLKPKGQVSMAFISAPGGTGKTSLALHCAIALQAFGIRTLLLEVDLSGGMINEKIGIPREEMKRKFMPTLQLFVDNAKVLDIGHSGLSGEQKNDLLSFKSPQLSVISADHEKVSIMVPKDYPPFDALEFLRDDAGFPLGDFAKDNRGRVKKRSITLPELIVNPVPEFPGLGVIFGVDGGSISTNMQSAVKEKFANAIFSENVVHSLKNTDYDVIIIDQGATTSFNDLDIAVQASQIVIPVRDDVSSISKSPGIINAAAARILNKAYKDRPAAVSRIKLAMQNPSWSSAIASLFSDPSFLSSSEGMDFVSLAGSLNKMSVIVNQVDAEGKSPSYCFSHSFSIMEGNFFNIKHPEVEPDVNFAGSVRHNARVKSTSCFLRCYLHENNITIPELMEISNSIKGGLEKIQRKELLDAHKNFLENLELLFKKEREGILSPAESMHLNDFRTAIDFISVPEKLLTRANVQGIIDSLRASINEIENSGLQEIPKRNKIFGLIASNLGVDSKQVDEIYKRLGYRPMISGSGLNRIPSDLLKAFSRGIVDVEITESGKIFFQLKKDVPTEGPMHIDGEEFIPLSQAELSEQPESPQASPLSSPSNQKDGKALEKKAGM